jgi:cell division protein FtsA
LAEKEFIAGLDIGTTKTCCVLAELNMRDSGVEIIGVGVVPSSGLKKGVVVDLDGTTESIRSAIEKAQNMAGNIAIRSVVIGVTGEHVSSLNSPGVVAITGQDREIGPADVERVIEQSKVIVLPPEREIIHAIPRGFTVDGQDGITDPVGMSGSRLEVETHIITGASSFVDNVVKCVQRAGYSVASTLLEPIATAEAAVLPAEKELGVALIDIGGGTTDVTVFTNGQIYYTAVLPVGGCFLTKDISVGLRAGLEESERVKLSHGCAMASMVNDDEVFEITSLGADAKRELPVELLAKIIEPRMQEIFQLVKQELIKAGNREPLSAGVVLTGGGSLMPGVLEMAEEILELPARMGKPENVGGLNDAVDGPMFTTSVGLVLFAAREQTEMLTESHRSTLLQRLIGLFRRFFS